MADQISWIEVDGTEWALDGIHAPAVQWGLVGHMGAPFRFLEQALPLEHGSQVFDVKVDTRTVTLPWEMNFATEADFRFKMDLFSYVFSPLRGPGKLRVTRVDGVQREFKCYLRSGFETLAQDLENGFAFNAPRGVFVFSGGPFWESTTENIIDLTNTSTGTWFPFGFPITLADSTLYASTTVINSGPVETWPLIKIDGPCTNVEIVNTTTGDSFACSYDITAGQSIVMDMRTIGNKSVRLTPGNLDLFFYTSGDMFPLQSAENNIEIRMDGSTGASAVHISFYKRYYNP